MSYTKKVALHDRITVDGVDMSNAFRSFGSTSEDQDVDVSGFSASGVDETLSGTRAQGFTGEMFITSENDAFMRDLHTNRTIFEVAWQKDGLVGSDFATEHALCQLRNYDPSSSRGQPYTTTVTFKVVDSDGITTS